MVHKSENTKIPQCNLRALQTTWASTTRQPTQTLTGTPLKAASKAPTDNATLWTSHNVHGKRKNYHPETLMGWYQDGAFRKWTRAQEDSTEPGCSQYGIVFPLSLSGYSSALGKKYLKGRSTTSSTYRWALATVRFMLLRYWAYCSWSGLCKELLVLLPPEEPLSPRKHISIKTWVQFLHLFPFFETKRKPTNWKPNQRVQRKSARETWEQPDHFTKLLCP